MSETTSNCKLCKKELNLENDTLLIEKEYCSYRCLEYDEIRQMTEAGIKDEGYKHSRTKMRHGDWEKAFSNHWKKENENRPGINYGHGILQDLFMEPTTRFIQSSRATLIIEPRDRYIAATVIQWLATNVGRGFLMECLNDCGQVIVEKTKK